MITLMTGDILNSGAEALVNTVNCAGVMGRGIALQFKKQFPKNFDAYHEACKQGIVQPGTMFVTETGVLTGPKYIINFPTKRHWKGKSRMEDIEAGLPALIRETKALGIGSIAVPPLGCGLGGLKWTDVKPRILAAFRDLPDVQVLLFEPSGPPPADAMVKGKSPEMTLGRAVLIELMARYLAAVMDPFVTLLEIHKLMYFMQESGQTLRLHYEKAPYGPYARNLRHVLNLIEGHYIVGYGDAEDSPYRPIELMPGATEKAAALAGRDSETLSRLERVAGLIHGFETPFGMELLATVHWVCCREGADSNSKAVEHTYAWNERKRAFTPEQIALARDLLLSQGWLAARA